MAIVGDGPFRRVVALRAVVAEQAAMPVFCLVACRAVELRLGALKLRCMRCGVGLLHPGNERIKLRIVCGGRFLHLLQADVREGDVIHFRRARDAALMFEMAGSACADVGVKGAGLALQDGLVIGMAHDAVLRLDALHWRVARSAVVFEKGVRLRQLPGRDMCCHEADERIGLAVSP